MDQFQGYPVTGFGRDKLMAELVHAASPQDAEAPPGRG